MKISTFHFVRLPASDGEIDYDLFEYELQRILWAEELGFDGVWLAEHHFRSEVCPSTIPLAAYVAAKTKRIRIGLGVLLLPFYNPIRLAEDIAVVDRLSGGRLDLGLGRGYNEMEFNGFSIPMDESRDRFIETLEVLQEAWTRGSINYSGNFHTIDQVAISPRPLQNPYPPIWIGASSTDTVSLCGKRGIPFMSDPIHTFEHAKLLTDLWKESAVKAGHDSTQELLALRPMWAAETFEQALEDNPVWVPRSLEEFDAAQINRFAPLDSSETEGANPNYLQNMDGSNVGMFETLEQKILRSNNYIIGDPQDVISKLNAHRIAGYNHVIGAFNSYERLPLYKMRQSMELFAREVLPRVQNL